MMASKFNSEGYRDPTVFETLMKVEQEERAARAVAAYRPLVYICSPYVGDIKRNTYCRTYSVRETIGKFLADVYEPSAMEGRYDYISADSSAGVIIIGDKFSYSFHATNPACGQLLNAFDVVRVHKFPDNDPKKSFNAMADFAVADENVKMRIFEEKQQATAEEFDGDDPDAWKKQLPYERRGMEIKNSLHNITLIMENDENLKDIVFNQLARYHDRTERRPGYRKKHADIETGRRVVFGQHGPVGYE